MAKRGGLSLSVKMILTTTLLVVLTVVGFGALSITNIRQTFDEAAKEQVKLFRQGQRQLGETGAPLLGRAVQLLITDRGRDLEVIELAKATVAQDTKIERDGATDYGLRLVYVLDPQQNVIADCIEAKTLACTPFNESHPPIGKVHGALTIDTWAAAKAQWQAEAARPGGGTALVDFEHEADGAKYRVFAFPVFGGAPPTAAGAIATEPPSGRLGYVVLAYDVAPIDRYILASEDHKAEASRSAVLYTGAIGALFALIGSVLAILQGLSITRPIKQLAWRANQIASGDLAARVEIKSHDEIGLLGQNFNFMADQITILLQQTAEKARLDQELAVAKAIQETLVPTAEPVDNGILKFAGFYQPAAQTGGDWWTWHQLTEHRILLVIGDVTGHGVPSAMITAAAKAACDVARYVHGDEVTVTRLLEIMNQAIFESAQRRFVMTCFASIVDTRARTITYANAGHNFPYLFRTAGDKGEFGSLMIRGNRLGDDQTSRYEAKTTELGMGDVIVWYTDGIVECENPKGEEYGEKRFRASVKRAAALDASEMRDAIVGDATAYFATMPRKDDITMIVGRIH
ncbi:MAG: SpoIIE family protein phosphatase [Proteobacteria bacterium]|nr:SpoIIE family protein phosphatase [Pseudomonadota bacterium]